LCPGGTVLGTCTEVVTRNVQLLAGENHINCEGRREWSESDSEAEDAGGGGGGGGGSPHKREPALHTKFSVIFLIQILFYLQIRAEI
jgi:hypothetical protein